MQISDVSATLTGSEALVRVQKNLQQSRELADTTGLVMVVDVSYSMRDAESDVKKALRAQIPKIDTGTSLAIVAFKEFAYTLFACKSLGPQKKTQACNLVSDLRCDGNSTNTHDGLKLAQAHSATMRSDGREHVNWLVLTDGKPNWSAVQDPRRLAAMCAGHRTCVINYTPACSLLFSDFVTQMPGCSCVFGSDGAELHGRVVDAVDALSKPPVDLHVVHMDTEGVVSERRVNTTDFDADGSCHVLFEVDTADEHALLSVVQKGVAGERDVAVFDAVKVVDVGTALDSVSDPEELARVTQLLEVERAYNRMGAIVKKVTDLGARGDFATQSWNDVAQDMEAMRIVKLEATETPDRPLAQNRRYRSLGVAMEDVERAVSSQQASAVVDDACAHVELPVSAEGILNGRVRKARRQQLEPGLASGDCDHEPPRGMPEYRSLAYGQCDDDYEEEEAVTRSLSSPVDEACGYEGAGPVFRSFPPKTLRASTVVEAVVGDARARSPVRARRIPTPQERDLAAQTPFRARSVRQL